MEPDGCGLDGGQCSVVLVQGSPGGCEAVVADFGRMAMMPGLRDWGMTLMRRGE